MTDTLKELFGEALAGEPTRPVVPDEDIARGRARRARQRRTRLSAGAAALAVAWLGALLVPDVLDDLRPPAVDAASPGYDELPPFVPDRGLGAQVSSGDGPASLESGASVVEQASGIEPTGMLVAVRDALPAAVTLDDSGASRQVVGRHHLAFSVERDGLPFTLQVWWQPSSEDARSFRPCTEPTAAFSRTAVWDACTEGLDQEARWRVTGTPDPQHRVVVVDGGPAAVTVAWDVASGDDTMDDLHAALSDDEAERIADVAWTLASDSGPGELGSRFGMTVVAASWPNVEAALTRVLGPLTRVELDQPNSNAPPYWRVHQTEPKVVTASYRTAGGGTVELAVWQAGPIYGVLCTVKIACDVWPGSRDYFQPLLEAPADAKGGTALGDQGQAYLVLDGVTGDAAALHRAALEAVFAVLPDPA